MGSDDKPYRVYRGGRTKGRVPAVPRNGRSQPVLVPREGAERRRLSLRRPRLPGRRSWKLVTLLALIGLIVLVIVWGVVGFFAFQDGVSAANKRLPVSARRALSKSNGFLFSHATTILLLGIDSSSAAARSGDRHSDSIMIVRTDPSHHRLAYLSIPRDLLVSIPTVGTSKINAAYQYGGPALAIKTIEAFTGIPIDHIVIVNFDGFKQLINAEGGITVDVPENILSNRFDCPYATQARCLQWPGWRFHKGVQHMSGERALIYSRIRENQLNPADNDLTREARQQAVIQAAEAKLLSFSTLVSLPFDGNSLFAPLATDLSPFQLLQLGWVKFRSSNSHALYCRLGGNAADVGGSSVLLPSEDNRATLAMWAGLAAPEPPVGTYGPGCQVGHPLANG
jgi:polyisoprenyl-teichoic acid--peptidoglycan teichoic acid transferase